MHWQFQGAIHWKQMSILGQLPLSKSNSIGGRRRESVGICHWKSKSVSEVYHTYTCVYNGMRIIECIMTFTYRSYHNISSIMYHAAYVIHRVSMHHLSHTHAQHMSLSVPQVHCLLQETPTVGFPSPPTAQRRGTTVFECRMILYVCQTVGSSRSCQ